MIIAAGRGKSRGCSRVRLQAFRRLLAVLLALLALPMLSTACSEDSANSDNPTPNELEEALTSGKPTLAGFVGEECACTSMRTTLFELAIEYDGRCNVVVIDVTKHKNVARQYGITLTPTQVFFDSSGAEVERIVGATPLKEMVDCLTGMGVV